jgi:hypothetical protein
MKVFVIASGIGTGLGATALCFLLGLQSRYWQTLATVNIATGVTSALVGASVTKKLKPNTQKIDRAIGRISERYSLSPDSHQVLIALEELRQEVDRD